MATPRHPRPHKPIRWPVHAEGRLRLRQVSEAQAREVVEQPERVVPGEDGRHVCLRRYRDGRNGKMMLVRVVVEETEFELVVVTVMRTSNLAKYWEERR
jgi:hypothetical protein